MSELKVIHPKLHKFKIKVSTNIKLKFLMFFFDELKEVATSCGIDVQMWDQVWVQLCTSGVKLGNICAKVVRSCAKAVPNCA